MGEPTCAVYGKAMLCHGNNSWGQLGLGSGGADVCLPDPHPLPYDWAMVNTHYNHACAQKEDGSVWCWGLGTSGQLANGPTPYTSYVPTQIGTATDWQSISAGHEHTCGIRSPGDLYCWGSNYDMEVGNGSTVDVTAPTLISELHDWSHVSTGVRFSCAIRQSGDLSCWGRNEYGQLGDGTNTARSTPTQVGSGEAWRLVATYSTFACAITTDNRLFCWGDNGFGQLGLGDRLPRNTPTQVGTDSDWLSVHLGINHTCALKQSGTLYCWGDNSDGRLGLGHTNSPNNSPQAVPHPFTWNKISIGQFNSCGVDSQNDLYCWGNHSCFSIYNTSTPFLYPLP